MSILRENKDRKTQSCGDVVSIVLSRIWQCLSRPDLCLHGYLRQAFGLVGVAEEVAVELLRCPIEVAQCRQFAVFQIDSRAELAQLDWMIFPSVLLLRHAELGEKMDSQQVVVELRVDHNRSRDSGGFKNRD